MYHECKPRTETEATLNDAADSSQNLACLYFVVAVIEQAVRDWRLARRCGFITKQGDVNGEMIQGYYRNSSNYKLPTAFDGPADIETLASFFKRGGLEVWLRFAGFISTGAGRWSTAAER